MSGAATGSDPPCRGPDTLKQRRMHMPPQKSNNAQTHTHARTPQRPLPPLDQTLAAATMRPAASPAPSRPPPPPTPWPPPWPRRPRPAAAPAPPRVPPAPRSTAPAAPGRGRKTRSPAAAPRTHQHTHMQARIRLCVHVRVRNRGSGVGFGPRGEAGWHRMVTALVTGNRKVQRGSRGSACKPAPLADPRRGAWYQAVATAAAVAR